MAKRKKARTAAQKAATRKMIAANKRRRGTKKNPTRRKATKKAPIGVRKSQKTGATSVVQRGRAKMTPAARNYRERVKSQLAGARGKKRTTIYRTRPSGKVTKIIRENPANRTKAIVSATGGFALGLVAADVLDRYIATRKTGDMAEPAYGQAAKAKINAKADGTRIFAQAAATGVSAVGAYMLRKKSTIGTYLLGGMAAGFAAKGFGLIVKDFIMPKVLPSEDGTSIGKRLGYVDGPRGYMGAPRPFQGKPTVVGPQATGSVGSYGCTRVPVNPSAYFKSTGGNRESCKPWPFRTSEADRAIEDVGRAPHGKMPSVSVPKPPMPVQIPTPPSGDRRREPNAEFEMPQVTPVPQGPPPVVRMPEQPNMRFRPVRDTVASRMRVQTPSVKQSVMPVRRITPAGGYAK